MLIKQAALQARMAAGGNPQQPIQPVPNGQQRPPTVNGAPPNGTPATGQNLTVPGQNQNRRPMPPQMAVPMQNGLRPPQALMNGMPQAPMQLPGQLPMPNPALDVGLISRAHQIQQQQRQQVQNGQMGQMPGQHNSPPRMNGMSPPGFAQMQNGMMPFPPNGNASPSGTPQGQAGSPRMGNETAPQAVRLEQQIRAKFPNASESDVRSMLVQQLQKSSQRQGLVQSAMNAAAGGMNGGMNMGIPPGIQSSPQLYAQMLRQQQEQQQKQAQAHQQAANAQANGNGGQQGHQRSGSGASGK
jgi:chromatin modification-related protein VID21